MGVIPKVKTCRVSGIFESGMFEYDSTLAYMSLADVQNFLDSDDIVHGIEVAIEEKELNRADQVARQIIDKTRARLSSPRTGCR